MTGIARFMKVTFSRFAADCPDNPEAWEAVRLPRRATAGSAGYDFFAPFDIELAPGETVTIPTGVRARIAPGWVLMLFPRSGLGFKYRVMLNNTVGVIDSDYFDALNEGHIFIRLHNAGPLPLSLPAGTAFAQGVFLPYGTTEDDAAAAPRTGGLGSTSEGEMENG